MVIVITGVLSAMTTDVITYPIKSFLALERRTTLVDTAELALRRMQRDIRRALPNSIRINSDGTGLELLHTLDGGRYRSAVDSTKAAGAGLCNGQPEADILDLTRSDDCFELIGSFTAFNPQATSGESIVVYNLGGASLTADAYAGNNRALLVNSASADMLNFNARQFPYHSAQQRFYIIDTPITYRCDRLTGQLHRYANYAIAAVQPDPPAVAGHLQASQIASCRFSYSSGVASRAGLVTIEMVLADASGEAIRLLQQVHVDNAP